MVMKCKQCDNEIVSTGNRIKQFCSDRCRMAYGRFKANRITAQSEQNVRIESEQIQSEHPKRTRPTIPGDVDYIGVCTKVDNRWAVTGTHRPQATVKDLDYSTLPDGVVKPYSEQPWSCTPEYQQAINNLMTKTVQQLEASGQFVPVWKDKQCA